MVANADLRETDLRDSLREAMKRLNNLNPPTFRLAIYPKVSESPALASLLERPPERPGESLAAFLLDLENAIRRVFFETPLPEFHGRCLGDLFGFTHVCDIWDVKRFDSVVADLRGDRTLQTFGQFSAQLVDRLGGPDTKDAAWRNSANYALAMLRWYGIWIERRIEAMRLYYLPDDVHAARAQNLSDDILFASQAPTPHPVSSEPTAALRAWQRTKDAELQEQDARDSQAADELKAKARASLDAFNKTIAESQEKQRVHNAELAAQKTADAEVMGGNQWERVVNFIDFRRSDLHQVDVAKFQTLLLQLRH
jgi:hypothetical protein